MPAGRTYHTQVSHGGYLYVVSGYAVAYGGSSPSYDGKMLRYDPSGDSWSEMAPVTNGGLNAGAYFQAAAHGDYIYAMSPVDGSSPFARYDPTSNTWTALASMVTVAGGRATGGVLGASIGAYIYFPACDRLYNPSSETSTPYNEMYGYDTVNDAWTSLTASNEQRILGMSATLLSE